MSLTYINQEDGPTITIREDANGRWASAMTAQWREVDEVLDGLLQNVAEGMLTCRQRPDDGEFMFKITARGNAKSEDMIGTDPEMAAFWAEVTRDKARPTLTPTAERVLVALHEGEVSDVAGLVRVTELSEGQVLQALELLAEVGFIEAEDA